jgi:paraquat-inducible protein B
MQSAKPAAVGGFVLGALIIVVVAILFFGGPEAFSSKTKAVVYFDGSVGGLGPGSPVTFRGVRVGSVSAVALLVDAKRMQARIPVQLKLEPDRVTLVSGSTGPAMLRRLIEAGLKARLESESLVTGQMLVDLDFNPELPVHLVGEADSDVPEIPSMPSDLEELRRQLTHAPIADTLVQARQTLAAIQRVADQVGSVIGPLTGGAQHALDSTGQTMDLAGVAIQGLQRSAMDTLGDVQALATDGRQQLSTRGQEIGHALATAEKALQASRDLLASANSLVARGARPRDDLEATLRDLAASASALRDLSQALDRDPNIALLGRKGR